MKKSKLPELNKCTIGVIGLGYVGFPLALKIANQKTSLVTREKVQRKVIGYDVDNIRISELNRGIDKKNIFSKEFIKGTKNIKFTNNKKLLESIEIFIITVPTPITIHNNPDLTFLKEASKIVGDCIKVKDYKGKNPIVIFESTVYPGVTEEICIPIIEKIKAART